MPRIPIRPHVPWHLENPIEIKLGHYPLFSPLSTLNLELLNSCTLQLSTSLPRHTRYANHATTPIMPRCPIVRVTPPIVRSCSSNPHCPKRISQSLVSEP